MAQKKNEIPENGTVNRQYKSTLFTKIFEDKEDLLSLYNAISGENCTSPDELELNTLGDEEGYETGFYLKIHNDLSFIIHHELHVYEHQSTWSLNMPLRMLMYVADIFKQELRKVPESMDQAEANNQRSQIYGTKAVHIPAPRFIVFYNGTDHIEDKREIRLSSLYEPDVLDRYKNDPLYPFLELTVTAYNINFGHNKKLMESCQRLGEYAEFVERASNALFQVKDENDKMKAMRDVVHQCIEDNILREFLIKNREAVIHMEFYANEIELRELAAHNDGYDEGVEAGRIEGRAEGREEGRAEMNDAHTLEFIRKIRLKRAKNKTAEVIADELEEPQERILSVIEVLDKLPSDTDEKIILNAYKQATK